MTDMPLLDLIAARTARDEGMARVEDHAQDDWRTDYRSFADLFLQSLSPGEHFIGEAIRAYAIRHGLDPPHHPNAWGAMAGSVLRGWLQAGWIVEDGVENARSVATHAHRYVRYQVRPW
jgi:hypothetical protein